jgi:hypothetical protein
VLIEILEIQKALEFITSPSPLTSSVSSGWFPSWRWFSSFQEDRRGGAFAEGTAWFVELKILLSLVTYCSGDLTGREGRVLTSKASRWLCL